MNFTNNRRQKKDMKFTSKGHILNLRQLYLRNLTFFDLGCKWAELWTVTETTRQWKMDHIAALHSKTGKTG